MHLSAKLITNYDCGNNVDYVMSNQSGPGLVLCGAQMKLCLGGHTGKTYIKPNAFYSALKGYT